MLLSAHLSDSSSSPSGVQPTPCSARSRASLAAAGGPGGKPLTNNLQAAAGAAAAAETSAMGGAAAGVTEPVGGGDGAGGAGDETPSLVPGATGAAAKRGTMKKPKLCSPRLKR
jgi:hypothetical protein